MTVEQSGRRPDLRSVAREQFLLVGLRLRPRLVALIPASAALGGVAAWGDSSLLVRAGSGSADAVVLAELYLLTIFVVVLVGLGAWRGEEPGRRAYHWALPVPRAVHGLLRVVAGGIWLAIVLLVGPLAAVVVSLLRAGEATVLASPFVWVSWIAVCTTLFLLSSAAAVLSEHPDRWVLGVPVVYLLVGIFIDVLDAPARLRHLWVALVDGPFGFGTALTGPVASLLPIPDFDSGEWASATAVWLMFGVVGLTLALRRYRDARE